MARIRTIKPEFWTSETVAQLSIPARLTFIGLWNESDDYGVVPDNARVLKGHIWPLDDDITATDVALHVQQMVDAKPPLVARYEAEGKRWLYIRGFRENQTINKPSQRRNPAPPAEILALPDDSHTPPVVVEEHYPEEREREREREREVEHSSSTDLLKQQRPQPVDDDDDRLAPTLERVAELHAATNGKTNRRGYAMSVKANAPTDGQLDAIRALLAAHPTRDPTWLADEHLGRPHPPNPNCPHCNQPRHPTGPCPTLLNPEDR